MAKYTQLYFFPNNKLCVASFILCVASLFYCCISITYKISTHYYNKINQNHLLISETKFLIIECTRHKIQKIPKSTSFYFLFCKSEQSPHLYSCEDLSTGICMAHSTKLSLTTLPFQFQKMVYYILPPDWGLKHQITASKKEKSIKLIFQYESIAIGTITWHLSLSLFTFIYPLFHLCKLSSFLKNIFSNKKIKELRSFGENKIMLYHKYPCWS